MSARRRWGGFAGAPVLAAAIVAGFAACKSGDYDGSYEGGIDGGAAADGSAISRVVEPDKLEVVATQDGIIDVTFGPGTFATPATITITAAGERTLGDTGLIVPIYVVAADKPATKFFQVSFHGTGNSNGGTTNHQLAPALQTAPSTFAALAIAGTSANSNGGGSGTFWGLSTAFGTFSLSNVSVQGASFADSVTSCTGKCCPTNGGQVAGAPSGCLCPTDPDLACFLAQCPDLAAAASRCSAIAAANNRGSVACNPFACTSGGGGPNCGSGGICGSGGAGGPNNFSACCVRGSGGSCDVGPCNGFAARCTKDTACPIDTQCCVFESESYCAKDCPPAQRACASNADCTDAGADAGTCQGGKCPVGVCGTPPKGCQ